MKPLTSHCAFLLTATCAPLLLASCAAFSNAQEGTPPASGAGPATSPLELADPTIDTIRPRIDFFASASTPFGMVALHPDTHHSGQLWNSGYRYGDKRILFFTHSHMVQTPGIPVMPVVGPVGKDHSSAFSHDQETIRPGYHRVKLLDSSIDAEMTATCRVGLSRYTFPACDEAHVLFELDATLADVKVKESSARRISPTRIAGYSVLAPTGRRQKPSAVYFVADFNRPLDAFEGKDATFRKLKAGEQVLMKVGLSYVSEEGAIKNLEAEMPGWDFEGVRAAAEKTWSDHFGRIEIAGGSRRQQVKFYTDLMHTAIGRRIYSDVDGTYLDRGGAAPVVRHIPLDENGRPRWQAIDMDCLWGTQWNLNILWTLAYPEYANWVSQTLLAYYRNNGILGRGQWGGDENFTMTGDTSLPLLVALANNGRAQFDLEEAYAAGRKNAFPGGVRDHAGYELGNKGGGMDWYTKLGYVPVEIENRGSGGHRGGSGMTLEYAYQDWCLGQLARQLGKTADAELFTQRSGNWRNVFDTSVGWARPRHQDGRWVEPFAPVDLMRKGEPRGFIEASPATFSFYVPQDLPGLFAAMGGEQAFLKKLDMCFEETKKNRFILPGDWIFSYVDYTNQPGCHMAHLFSHAGAPWKTQYWVRQVKELAFGDITPKGGYNGDEDEGQMGALGVLMSIGLFDVQGAVGADPKLEITSPLFDKVVLHTPDKAFEIRVLRRDADKDIYIQSARLNGKPWNDFQFPLRDVLAGGTLEIELGPMPNKAWGVLKRLPDGTLAAPKVKGGRGRK